MFPRCVLTEGGMGLTRGNDRSLFIHCMNRRSVISPLTGPGAVCGSHSVTSDRVCPAVISAIGGHAPCLPLVPTCTRDRSLQSENRELCV